ncbi:transthyretin domain-containing protein [Emydomyces testavorans]|uniref:Transthyretin domain-containing protein n=1 Tax=Emydomyces testavorans TaxID=2070801 RepID=A0AAF0IG22_9EURO|nr:transthyretin domain-containing protein [Emydomyces testavorans]
MDPITCHVLNTHNGTPAAGLSSSLTLLDVVAPPNSTSTFSLPQNATFYGSTDSDGRVKTWRPSDPSSQSLAALIASFPSRANPESPATRSTWDIRFLNVATWYEERGVESFWPEVVIKFMVEGKEGEAGWRHYHVPLLLGPWSYSTYRGS